MFLESVASNLSVDQRGERQVVEQVCEVLPHVGVAVLPQALVVEAVDLRDLPRLVVPSQDGDSLLETNLNRRKKKKNLSDICINTFTTRKLEFMKLFITSADSDPQRAQTSTKSRIQMVPLAILNI